MPQIDIETLSIIHKILYFSDFCVSLDPLICVQTPSE